MPGVGKRLPRQTRHRLIARYGSTLASRQRCRWIRAGKLIGISVDGLCVFLAGFRQLSTGFGQPLWLVLQELFDLGSGQSFIQVGFYRVDGDTKFPGHLSAWMWALQAQLLQPLWRLVLQ